MKPMNADEFGHWGEEIAAAHLQSMGYWQVARNWRSNAGEIDLVMRHEDAWVFVEVKARRTDTYGTPEEAVTADKQRRLVASARAYLAEHQLEDVSWRIDVVTVSVTGGDYGRPVVEVYQNAVSGE